jgi:hypothetical protein
MSMRRLIGYVLAVAGTLIALLPGISHAGKNLNHAQTLLLD